MATSSSRSIPTIFRTPSTWCVPPTKRATPTASSPPAKKPPEFCKDSRRSLRPPAQPRGLESRSAAETRIRERQSGLHRAIADERGVPAEGCGEKGPPAGAFCESLPRLAERRAGARRGGGHLSAGAESPEDAGNREQRAGKGSG